MENRNFAGDLQISKVNKWYPGDVHAVKDMDMEIKRGEFIVFVGPFRLRKDNAAAHDCRT